MVWQRRPRPIGIVDPTQGGKAGNKDPRVAVRGNNPYAQPDIAQIAQIRRDVAERSPSQYAQTDGATPDGLVLTSPVSLQSIPWAVTTVVGFVPILWVPRNPARKGLLFCNDTAATAIHISVGAPPLVGGLPIGGTIGPAVIVGPWYPAPTDDIFVFANAVVTVVAYEMFELPTAQR